jgi:hypothetical protein
LNKAAEHGHLDVAQFLCANRSEGYNSSALGAAHARGHHKVARLLREHQAKCHEISIAARAAAKTCAAALKPRLI